MPVLENERHEKFAQLVALGTLSDADAFEKAGYARHDSNCARLIGNDRVASRIKELREMHAKKSIEALGITRERVMAELAAIGFSKIRRAVKWSPQVVAVEDEDDSTGLPRITRTINNNVEVIASNELDEDTASAIQSIAQDASGGVKLKMYDKKGALMLLGKELGMFKEQVEVSGTITLEMMVHESMRNAKTIEHEPIEDPKQDLLEGL